MNFALSETKGMVKNMKKRICTILLVCATLGLTAAVGYFVGSKKSSETLPVYESTALYPELTMQSLTNMATYILHAEVSKVGNTIMREIPVSLTVNPEESTETISYPVTPITLSVIKSIKGDTEISQFVYYEDGGITSSYIQLPDGYVLEEGMEIMLFLSENGACWGAQSMFPVIDSIVILNHTALQYIDNSFVTTLETGRLNSTYKNQISKTTVNTMNVTDFIVAIENLLTSE